MQELAEANFYQSCIDYFICYLWKLELPGSYIPTYYKAMVNSVATLMPCTAVNYGDRIRALALSGPRVVWDLGAGG